MIGWVEAYKCGNVIIVDLYFGEIGHAFFALAKNAVAATAMQFVQHFSLLTFFGKQLPVEFGYVNRNIVLRFLLRYALRKQQYAQGQGSYADKNFHDR
jgi:hypothetical protein